LALSKIYADRGDRVIGVCRQSSEQLNALAVEIIDGIDLAKPEDIEKLRESLNGRVVDLLINNAGILRSMSLDTLDYAQIMSQFEVNAVAPLRVVETLLPNLMSGSKIAMITIRMGSIEDNSSGGTYGYRMSKTALNAAGKSLAIDLKPKGIAVALLHPGYVKTEMVNYSGEISPSLAAERLSERIDELNLDNSGSFWHSNGQELPW